MAASWAKINQDGFQLLFRRSRINSFQVVAEAHRINVKLTEKDGEVTDFNFSGFRSDAAGLGSFVSDC